MERGRAKEGSIDPLHGKYGTAFGVAAATLVKHLQEDREVALGKAMIEFAKHWFYLDQVSNKNVGVAYCGLIQLHKVLSNNLHGWEFDGAECRTTILVDGAWTLAGAFDVRLRSTTNPDLVMYLDFKAIASEYNYKFDRDFQLWTYRFMDWLFDRRLKYCQDYFVVLNTNEVSVGLRSSTPHLANHFPAHIARAISMGEAQALVAVSGIDTVQPALWMCEKCKFDSVCNGSEEFVADNAYHDDRVFSDVKSMSITSSELLQLAHEFAASMKSQGAVRIVDEGLVPQDTKSMLEALLNSGAFSTILETGGLFT